MEYMNALMAILEGDDWPEDWTLLYIYAKWHGERWQVWDYSQQVVGTGPTPMGAIHTALTNEHWWQSHFGKSAPWIRNPEKSWLSQLDPLQPRRDP